MLVLLEKYLLLLHNFIYKAISICAVRNNNGTHPKKNILRYYNWFLSKVSKDDIVLDIGSNDGEMAFFLSQHVNFTYGIEISPKKHQKATSLFNSRNLIYINADATLYNYQLLPKKISVITLSNVLEHIEDRITFLNKIINNVSWTQKSKKKILIRVPTIERDWLSVYKKNKNIEYRLDRTHFIEYTLKEFLFEINAASLIIDEYSIRFGEIYAVCSQDKNL